MASSLDLPILICHIVHMTYDIGTLLLILTYTEELFLLSLANQDRRLSKSAPLRDITAVPTPNCRKKTPNILDEFCF